MTSADAPTESLSELIWRRYSALLDMRRRVYVLRAFVDEMSSVTLGKPFQIRNDIAWNIVLDSRDKCVIDLYSWAVELRHGMLPLEPGVKPPNMKRHGLFRLIQEKFCSGLTRTAQLPGESDAYLVELNAKERALCFSRLFPACTGESPSPRDIQALCEAFRIRFVALGKDRNKNRAHVHEGDFGTVPSSTIVDLEALFLYCETLLKDLVFVCASTSYGGGDMNVANTPRAVADLVDLILFGTSAEAVRLQQTSKREVLFARLHALDDVRCAEETAAHGSGPVDGIRKKFFNQRQCDPDFDDAPGGERAQISAAVRPGV